MCVVAVEKGRRVVQDEDEQWEKEADEQEALHKTLLIELP